MASRGIPWPLVTEVMLDWQERLALLLRREGLQQEAAGWQELCCELELCRDSASGFACA